MTAPLTGQKINLNEYNIFFKRVFNFFNCFWLNKNMWMIKKQTIKNNKQIKKINQFNWWIEKWTPNK